MSSDFYRAFEDRHRGSREDIAQRHRVYLPFLDALREIGVPPRLVDIGCGRGEWLQLARGQGWDVQGVDADEGMLSACREAGLDVRAGDALDYLRSLGDGSAGVVSALHVAEHLPFDALRSVVTEALRVLAPGGVLVLETPNPENLVVGSSAFYMDPTHAKPLPPLLLGFLAQFAGFSRVATLRLHEGITGDRPVALIDVLAGVSPDYAIVAQKPGASSAALDALFAAKHGVNLNELAERWESQLQARLRDIAVSAGMGREGVVGLAWRIEALERENATRPAVERRASERVLQLQEQVRALQESTSWRVTAPLRWAGEQAREIKDRGASAAVRDAARASVLGPPRALHRWLAHTPRIRSVIGRIARAFGLGFVIKRVVPAPPPPPPPPPPLDPATLTADARREFEVLRQATASAHRKDR